MPGLSDVTRMSTVRGVTTRELPLVMSKIHVILHCFQTNYSIEIGCREAIYGRKSIDGSVEWLCIPAPCYDTGVAWTENMFVPSLCWGDGVTYATLALVTQYGVLIGSDVPWCSIIPTRPAYLPRNSSENALATVCHVRDARHQENRLAQAKNVLYAHHIGGDARFNQSDDD